MTDTTEALALLRLMVDDYFGTYEIEPRRQATRDHMNEAANLLRRIEQAAEARTVRPGGRSAVLPDAPSAAVEQLLYEGREAEAEGAFREKRTSAAADPLDVEALAAVEHEQWIEWSQAIAREGLTPERIERWQRYWVPYDQLDEATKEHDRKWARRAYAAAMKEKESHDKSK